MGGIFLLALVLYYSVGFVGYFEYRLHTWRCAVRTMLRTATDQTTLQIFILSDTELNSDEAEMTINGIQYDIAKIVRIDAQHVQVFAYADATETRLLQTFAANKNPTEQNPVQNILYFFKQLSAAECPALVEFDAVVMPWHWLKKSVFAHHITCCAPFSVGIDAPPPEGCA